MAKIIKPPFLYPSKESISFGVWKSIINGVESNIGPLLANWDPATEIEVCVEVEADCERIFQECGLESDASLLFTSVWNSSGTMLRGIGDHFEIKPSFGLVNFKLNLKLKGVILSKEVELSVQLILKKSSKAGIPLSPKHPGTIITRSIPFQVLLEGEGSRFPIDIVDFKNSPFPTGAAWALSWDPTNLNELILGDFRLNINSLNNKVVRAVTQNIPEDDGIRESIRYDVARLLIISALDNREFVENPDSYGRDTVGAVIRNTIRTYFPNRSFSDLYNESKLLQTFEPKLQEKLHFLNSED